MIKFNVIQTKATYGSLIALVRELIGAASYVFTTAGNSRVASVRGNFQSFLNKSRNEHNRANPNSKLSHNQILQGMLKKEQATPVVFEQLRTLTNAVCRTVSYSGYPSDKESEEVLSILAADYIEQNPVLKLEFSDLLIQSKGQEVIKEVVKASAQPAS